MSARVKKGGKTGACVLTVSRIFVFFFYFPYFHAPPSVSARSGVNFAKSAEHDTIQFIKNKERGKKSKKETRMHVCQPAACKRKTTTTTERNSRS